VLSLILDENDKITGNRCSDCGKKIIFTEDIKKDIIGRMDRIQKLLEKVTNLEYGDIDVVEVGINRVCDINEVALLCKYFQCGLAKLSGHVKRLIPKEKVKI